MFSLMDSPTWNLDCDELSQYINSQGLNNNNSDLSDHAMGGQRVGLTLKAEFVKAESGE